MVSLILVIPLIKERAIIASLNNTRSSALTIKNSYIQGSKFFIFAEAKVIPCLGKIEVTEPEWFCKYFLLLPRPPGPIPLVIKFRGVAQVKSDRRQTSFPST